jgi:hypothetical protein
MSAMTDRLAGGLWLDYTAYAGRLLAGGSVPWLDVDGANGWMRKAQSLLKSDVAVLPAAAVVAAWLDAHGELVTTMGAKRRSVYPLKTLLADEPLRAHLAELARVLRAGLAKVPLLLSIPSPKLWVAQAYLQANGDSAEVDADAVDSAAAYIADFLRLFADSGIDGVVLEETAASEPATAEDLALYQPLFNVAAHYRWDVGLHLPGDGRYTCAPGGGLTFALAPRPQPGIATGMMVPAGFWNGDAAPVSAGGGFRYAEIPADANPESVLERLALLR